jgi:hypothetical protein
MQPQEGSLMIIPNVDRYRVREPLFEGARVVLSHLGADYSPAYVQGVSGAAFRIAGICPCAPTCSSAMDTAELVDRLGYRTEQLPLDVEAENCEEQLSRLLDQVRAEIDAERPVLLWHAFSTCEWDVVCGYDRNQGLLFGRSSKQMQADDYAQAPETRAASCADNCPSPGLIMIGSASGRCDHETLELESLRTAVRHAHSPAKPETDNDGDWAMLNGLPCYDRWAEAFTTDPDREPDAGDEYCLDVYRSTHHAAADFVREIAPRYPTAFSHLIRAACEFEAESQMLDRLFQLRASPPAESDPPNERMANAGAVLSCARDRYAAGIGCLERALATLRVDI